MDCKRHIAIKGTEDLRVRYLGGGDDGNSIYRVELDPTPLFFHEIIYQRHAFESFGYVGYIRIENPLPTCHQADPYTGRPYTSVNTFANVLPDFYPGLASPYQLMKLLKGRGHSLDTAEFIRHRWPIVVDFLRRQEEIQINKRLDNMIKRYGLYEEKNP